MKYPVSQNILNTFLVYYLFSHTRKWAAKGQELYPSVKCWIPSSNMGMHSNVLNTESIQYLLNEWLNEWLSMRIQISNLCYAKHCPPLIIHPFIRASWTMIIQDLHLYYLVDPHKSLMTHKRWESTGTGMNMLALSHPQYIWAATTNKPIGSWK